MLQSNRGGRFMSSNNKPSTSCLHLPESLVYFQLVLMDRLLPSHLLTIDCGRVESVKKTAGEVNCSDKIKFLDVAFTFDALCWKFLTCSIFLKPLKQPPIKLLWLLPFKAINSWKGEEKFKCNFVLASFF